VEPPPVVVVPPVEPPPVVVPPVEPPPLSTERNAYFEAMIARPDCTKAHSLRPRAGDTDPASPYFQDQLNLQYSTKGGLLARKCLGIVEYDPAHDATVLRIDPFQTPGGCDPGYVLTAPLLASTPGASEVISVKTVTSTFGPPGQRQIRVDDEVLELRPLTIEEGGDGIRAYAAIAGILGVIRGQYGTEAVAHDAGAQVRISANSLNPYLHIPIKTEDGHSYLWTWDELWDSSYLGLGKWNAAQKTYQLRNGKDAKLFEPRIRFDGGTPGVSRPANFDPMKHVGAVDVRLYNSSYDGSADWTQSNGNTLGPGFELDASNTYLKQQVGTFAVEANVRTRWSILLEQRKDDWDAISLWVADVNTDPVLIADRVLISVSGGGSNQSLRFFDFEHADSTTGYLRGGLFPLNSFACNWVQLTDPGDIAGLLQRPPAST
jgi:hypothetical protein